MIRQLRIGRGCAVSHDLHRGKRRASGILGRRAAGKEERGRILLRAPLLPAELLPAGWNGTAAYQLCRNLYQVVYQPADDFMSASFATADGPLPPPAAEFYKRFGGLKQTGTYS